MSIEVMRQLKVQANLDPDFRSQLMKSPLPEELLSRVGTLTEHVPVEDFTAPTLHQVEQTITLIHFYLGKNMPVAVHCIAGLGRTGTIIACYLVGEGKSAEEAITTVRRWRPGSIETLDQEAVILQYEQFLRSGELCFIVL